MDKFGFLVEIPPCMAEKKSHGFSFMGSAWDNFHSNSHYEWENGSSHEWLPPVTSVLDVSACLPT